jgi:hypothetical protein
MAIREWNYLPDFPSFALAGTWVIPIPVSQKITNNLIWHWGVGQDQPHFATQFVSGRWLNFYHGEVYGVFSPKEKVLILAHFRASIW